MSSVTKHSRSKPGSISARSDTVPYLSLCNGLEIQSTPIQLATRSLSARSLTSLSSNHQPSSSKTKRSTLPPKNDRRLSTSGRHLRKKGTSTVNNRPSTSEPILCESKAKTSTPQTKELALGSKKGFNIVGHLRDSAELDRSSGSLSPDVDQFLKDIGAIVAPLSPEIPKVFDGTHTDTVQVIDSTAHANMHNKKANRPKVAANFGGSNSHDQTKKPAPTHIPKLSLETKQPDVSKEVQSQTIIKSFSSPPPTQAQSQEIQLLDQNAAAVKIQSWYRRVRSTQLVSVQSVLQEKKDELNRGRAQELLDTESKQLEKQQRRAARMQAARKAAIEELNKKREQKRLKAEKIAQEEIVLLQANGKIKKPNRNKAVKPLVRPKSEKENQNVHECNQAPDQVIDKFFQAGRVRSPAPPVSNESSLMQPSSTTIPKQGSTLSDILETLKLLEEVPSSLTSHNTSSERGYLSAENLQKLASQPANTTVSSSESLTEGKLSNILAYLDEMEKADQDLLSQLSRPRTELKTMGTTTAGEIPQAARNTQGEKENQEKIADASLEAATAAASDVTTTILAQRIELDNKNKTIEMMQKALTQQRELTVYHAKEMEKDGQKKINLLRTEYESRIQRHQAFIDQLIDDKKVLSERCEQLVKQLRELDKKYKTNLKSLEEKHSTEVSKLKQVTAAAEKLRREKWKSEETQRIKETTVKSLEPEIQRIIAKGKGEVQKLKALHEAELLQADERASRRFVVQMEELRAQCAEEKEQACAHERELARQRYEKMAEQEEINYQQLRRKLFAEVQQEKGRLADQFQQQKLSTEQRIKDMQHANQCLLNELKSEHARQTAELERRHSCQLKDLTERSKIEKEAWEENVLKRQETTLLTKEREMREQLRKDRDKEIEMVITRLEEETRSSKEELERAAEARVRRVREKYETELREVERSERSTLDKFNNLKTQVVECEGELSCLRTLLRQKQEEVERVSEVASKLTRERDSVADIVRQEFADRLVQTEEENKELKIEMSELRARHKVELDKVSRDKDREMDSVHDRVKQALSKKEENLQSLREQYESALKRADHLEMLLEQQRKQLLKK